MTDKAYPKELADIGEQMQNAEDPAEFYLLDVKWRLTNRLLGLTEDSEHSDGARVALRDAISVVDDVLARNSQR